MQAQAQESSSSSTKPKVEPDIQFWSHLNDPLGLNPDIEYDREGGLPQAEPGTVEHESNQPLLGEDYPEPYDAVALCSGRPLSPHADLPEPRDCTSRIAERL